MLEHKHIYHIYHAQQLNICKDTNEGSLHAKGNTAICNFRDLCCLIYLDVT